MSVGCLWPLRAAHFVCDDCRFIGIKECCLLLICVPEAHTSDSDVCSVKFVKSV